MIRALIFDFDGILLDTETPDFEQWQVIYREHGGDLTLEQYGACIGTTIDARDPLGALERTAGRPLDREALFARHRDAVLRALEGEPPMPGVLDYLSDARRLGLRLGVASSSYRDWVQGNLDRLGLAPHFDCVQTRTEVPRAKPDPDLYLAALRDLGIAAHEALAFEDSPPGITAARAAGIFCVAVPNSVTRHLPIAHADLTVASLAETPLVELLKRVNGAA